MLGVVHDLGLWHGVLAFGLGLVLGLSFDTVPAALIEDETPVAGHEAAKAPQTAPGTVQRTREAVDDPLSAEREAAHEAQPHTVVVGPKRRPHEEKTGGERRLGGLANPRAPIPSRGDHVRTGAASMINPG